MKRIIGIFIALTAISNVNAQTRVITTGIPFVLVAADARSAGLADQGVATDVDAFSQQYNPAKYAFSEYKKGFSTSYTPYLTGLVNDISLGQVTGFYKLDNERSAFAGSLRYFSLGEINQTNSSGESLGNVSPNEFAIDGSYSQKLSEKFSMAVAFRYLRSNLRIASELADAKPAGTFAVDVAGYFHSDEIALTDFNGRWRAGFNLQNMGPKLNYNDDETNENFLPANLKLGAGYDFGFDEYNKISLNLELNKLMVPTPPNTDGMTAADKTAAITAYNKIGWAEGMVKSFTDAPDGFSEELKEITYSIGTEYTYQDSFALRLGYFYETLEKGGRKFFSLGAGFKYNVIKVDVSYLFSGSNIKNPLENTLRFSLTLNFGDKLENN